MKEFIDKLVQRQNLTLEESHKAMSKIMLGDATPVQIASYLTALRMKGETIDEITGAARAMREVCIKVPVERDDILDTCGTGEDGLSTFNISTTSAFVIAGAGIGVAKHGNRAVSSKCGSADVIEFLGIRLELTPLELGKCIDEIGIGFLFAPSLHPAMEHAMLPRREMGIRTLFNIMGPLLNPANAKFCVLGVYSSELTHTVATVLSLLGSKSAFVVHFLQKMLG